MLELSISGVDVGGIDGYREGVVRALFFFSLGVGIVGVRVD
jgi:hypothetical protein